MLWVFAAVISMFWILYLSGARLYLGIGAQILLLPMAYYALQRRWRRVALTIVLVLLAGKRGSYATIPIMLLFVTPLMLSGWSSPGRSRRPKKDLAAMVATAAASLGGAMLLIALDPRDLPVVGSVVGKWQAINPFVQGFDIQQLNLGTGQRIYEVIYSWQEFTASSWHWLLGRGYGWTYESPIYYRGTFESHYIHFSPLNFVYSYGPLLAVAFLAMLAYKLAVIGRRAFVAGEPASYTLFITLVGLLFTGFFGYSYGTDPAIWIFLGILNRRFASRPVELRGTADALGFEGGGRFPPGNAGGSVFFPQDAR